MKNLLLILLAFVMIGACSKANALDLYVIDHVDQASNFTVSPKAPNQLVYASWATVEPSDGTFNWTNIDNALGSLPVGAHAALAISPGENSPAWLLAEVATVVSNGITYPAPWDAVYESKLASLIQAAGERYSGDTRISRVAIPGLSSHAINASLDAAGATLDQWSAVGYTPNKAVQAFLSGAKEVHYWFPTTPVVEGWLPANAGLSFDTTNGATAIGVMLSMAESTIGMIEESDGATVNGVRQFNTGDAVVYQEARATGSGVNTIINEATAAGAVALEIYASDVPYIK